MTLSLDAIENPKRRQSRGSKSVIYNYYTAYSNEFVSSVITQISTPHRKMRILDPWNGSGTTSLVANEHGHYAYGFDLNPVMAIVAKGRLVSRLDLTSLVPLAKEIIRSAKTYTSAHTDPLNSWFNTEARLAIRGLERSIMDILTENRDGNGLIPSIPNLSTIACCLLTALFVTCRELASPLRSSNPTWLKLPKFDSDKLNASRQEVFISFLKKVESLAIEIGEIEATDQPSIVEATIDVGDSRKIPVRSNHIDAVITSPPYCTRIDYGRITLLELCVLGLSKEDFGHLRKNLMGSSMSLKVDKTPEDIGATCSRFLQAVKNHPSKSSETYYYNNHLKYFSDLSVSIKEIARVMKNNASAFIVVQDSFYKDIYNDLPTIVAEIGELNGLRKIDQKNFTSNRNMRHVNLEALKYRSATPQTESIVVLQKLRSHNERY